MMVNEVPDSVEGCPLQCLERLSVRLHVIEEIKRQLLARCRDWTGGRPRPRASESAKSNNHAFASKGSATPKAHVLKVAVSCVLGMPCSMKINKSQQLSNPVTPALVLSGCVEAKHSQRV